MKPSLFFPLLALVFTAMAATAAHARSVECKASNVAKCVVAAESAAPRAIVSAGSDRSGSIRAVKSSVATAAPVVMWSPSVAGPFAEPLIPQGAALSSQDAQNADPSYLGLLLAAIGIVAFMAHRRSGV